MSSLQNQAVATHYRYCSLKSTRFPTSNKKPVLGNIANKAVFKIITTENSRIFDQYFVVFLFGKRHLLEYLQMYLIIKVPGFELT